MLTELQIPESVGQAIRLPEDQIRQELLTELAVALYSRGIISFGKARELAETGKYEFGRMLGERGVITMEFPHLQRLIEGNQFDTIYHEHFSYLSFVAVNRIFAHHGITLFDVDELPTHGGSLRIYGRHTADQTKRITDNVRELLNREKQLGFESHKQRTFTNWDYASIYTTLRIIVT